MTKEKELAEQIYSFLEGFEQTKKEKAEPYVYEIRKRNAAIDLGYLLQEARHHDIVKTLFALNAIYLDKLQAELKSKLVSNKQTYQDIEDLTC